MHSLPNPSPAPACPECLGLGLLARRTREGLLYVCVRCHGYWDSRARTPLAPLLAEALERRSRTKREDTHRLQGPEAPHRCPSCAMRLEPGELRGQPVELCPHCPGLWLGPKAWDTLRRDVAPSSWAVRLGAGGSVSRDRSPWPRRALFLLSLGVTAAAWEGTAGLFRLLWSLLRGG